MTFDNSKTIISLRIKFFGATIVFLAFIILTYAAKLIKYPLLGMSDTMWTVILVGIYLFILVVPALFVGRKYGLWWGVAEVALTIIWVIVVIILLILFYFLNQSLVVYPMSMSGSMY